MNTDAEGAWQGPEKQLWVNLGRWTQCWWMSQGQGHCGQSKDWLWEAWCGGLGLS